MLKGFLKKIFWKLPIGQSLKHKIQHLRLKRMLDKEKKYDLSGRKEITQDSKVQTDYINYIVDLYRKKSCDYMPFVKHESLQSEVHLVAYYLTQFHPNEYNDAWWGKGTTEWNNVNQAIPQYIGHYQPRKPGELGYYDLRIKETFLRQIELAKNYGIEAFCFYYYWFDGGKRLLDFPLNQFLKSSEMNIKFFYCWANENWTKRFTGTNEDILLKISQTEENYKAFIESVIPDFQDNRYYRINNKPVLLIYCPSYIPEPEKIINYWRKKTLEEIGLEIYLIAVQERGEKIDWLKIGFDAESEFQPKQVYLNCKDITKQMKTVRTDFAGVIYDYASMVEGKGYIIPQNQNRKVYPAVMPMWDNTARRNFRGSIYHGSTPELYKQWLSDIVNRVEKREELDDKLVFINAWNEWGEGAYLEPDDYYGYAYLEATYQALLQGIKD